MLIDHLKKIQPMLFTPEENRKLVLTSIAGLLHDIGHGPFSHLFDEFLHSMEDIREEWKCHEQRGIVLLKDMIDKYKLPIEESEIEFISEMIQGVSEEGKPWYYYLVNNKISGLDFDKMDYVLRDSMHFGMKISFDPVRIIKNCRIIDNELCFCDRIQDEIITVFLIRNKMNRYIYRHPKVCRLENELLGFMKDYLYSQCIKCFQSNNIIEFLDWNDQKILSLIPRQKYWKWECRIPTETDKKVENRKVFIETEWNKIMKLKFYRKKAMNESFQIQDWNIVSCY
jgi:HD superfamily phosphohydrolase